MSLKELEYELDGLIEIKERLLDEDDESIHDEIDEAIGRLLASMSKQERETCDFFTQLNVYGHATLKV